MSVRVCARVCVHVCVHERSRGQARSIKSAAVAKKGRADGAVRSETGRKSAHVVSDSHRCILGDEHM